MGSFWYGATMKTFTFCTLLFICPVVAFALTTEEYLGFMPELMATQSNTWLAIYTMSTGSLIAFYFFGWDANWFVRIFGGLFILGFVNQSLIQNKKAYHTEMEAYVLFLQKNDICDESTPTYKLFSAFNRQNICSASFTAEQRIDMTITALKEANLIGSGVFYTNLERKGTGFDLLMTGNIGAPFVVWSSILIWFLVPSRAFFIRRGWIKES